jgi:nucleoside-diphosphate-sugar epimerase
VFASTCSVYDKGLYAEDFLLDEASEVSPRAAYAVSNYEAERALLAMADDRFCPVILRKGTLYGFSPRMRYDLVVNTFVKDALMNGLLKVFCGGEMWRPLVDVTDAAKAYICCVEAPEHKVHGQIFNLVFKNYRVLELAHWVREAFKPIKKLEIEVDYSHYRTRSYRVSGQKIETVLGFKPSTPVKESVEQMVKMIQKNGYTDFLNPKYYNIQWLMLLSEMEGRLKRMGSVF